MLFLATVAVGRGDFATAGKAAVTFAGVATAACLAAVTSLSAGLLLMLLELLMSLLLGKDKY